MNALTWPFANELISWAMVTGQKYRGVASCLGRRYHNDNVIYNFVFTNLKGNLNETTSNSVKLGESESNIDSTAACIFCIHLCKTLRSSGEVQLRVGCAADWLASAQPGWPRRGSQVSGLLEK